jgi:predicted RNase H-like nuclease (RuvC/YqgF family)
MPRIEFDPVYDDPKLGEEARQIVQEASSSMEAWIDKQIDNLKNEYTKKIDDAAAALENQVREIESQFTETDKVLSDFVNELGKITIRADNLPNLQATIEVSKKMAENLRADLKKREDQWKSAGAAAMKLAISAAKTAMA